MLYANLPQNVRDYDPLAAMVVKDAAHISSARAAAIQKIFGVPELDTEYRVTPGPYITDWSAYANTTNLAYIQKFTAALPFGIDSDVYFMVPSTGRPVPGVVIYHEGHGVMGVERTALLKSLIASGYIVAIIDMPFNGVNAAHAIITDIAGVGPCRLWTHQHLALLDSDDFSPLRMFLLPVLAVVNHCHYFGVTNIAMMGISGGGWTSTLYPALDPRILRSYSVSGTMPRYLSGFEAQNDLGEWEAFLPGLGLDYLDLYVMAAAGRTHWQVGNVNDPACFSGTRQDCFKTQIANLVQGIGGNFAVIYDTTATAHEISMWALDAIKTDIGTQF